MGKSPRRHTVRTKHPRYNVPEYLRGSCGVTPRVDGSGMGVGNHNADVLRDVLNLSSGTMATLTGKTKYDELEAEQRRFAEFVQTTPLRFESWYDAWNAHKLPRGITAPSPTIGTVQGEAKYVKTLVEDQYGNWDRNYWTRDGYYLIHKGSVHHVYRV